MPISLTCPECDGKLRVADNLAGKKIKCPKCSAVFAVAAEEGVSAQKPAAAPNPAATKKGIAAEVSSRKQRDEDEEELDRPRKKIRDIRRDPGDGGVSTLIPYKNAKALIAYYLGVFSFIPCVGLLLGPAALLLGFLGLRYVKTYPTAKGTGHAIAGIIMGGLTTLVYWGLAIAVFVLGGLGAIMGKSQTKTLGGPVAIVSNNPPMGKQPNNPPVPGPAEVNLGQPLFSGDRDLMNPAQKLNLPAETGRVAALRMGQRIHALAFTRDGKCLAVANQSDVKIWDLQKGQSRIIRVYAHSLAFSPDGNRLAVGQNRGGRASVLEIYDARTVQMEKSLFQGQANQTPEQMAFSPDGTLFASTIGTTFRLWETATWQDRPHSFRNPTWKVGGLMFDPKDPKMLDLVLNGQALFWDITTRKELFSIKTPEVGGSAMAISSDGQTLATGQYNGDLHLFDVSQRKFRRRLGILGGRIHSLSFTPDDRVLFSTSERDGTLRLWDMVAGKEIAKCQADEAGKQLTAFAASADGKTVLTGSSGGLIKVWDVAALRGQGK